MRIENKIKMNEMKILQIFENVNCQYLEFKTTFFA